jgi:archaellum component FlaC
MAYGASHHLPLGRSASRSIRANVRRVSRQNLREFARFQRGRPLAPRHRRGRCYDGDLSSDGDEERIAKVEAVIAEFREQFAAIDSRFDAVDERFDRIDHRFDDIDRRFERVDLQFEAVDLRFEAVDRRFDALEQRLNSKLDLHVERLEQLVTTTAEGFAGVLSSLEREIREFGQR